MKDSPVITVDTVSVGYADTCIWHDANFVLHQGEFVAVLGPNGSGKTTFCRLLLGLMPPSKGAVTVFGKSPSRGDARIGYVPQRHDIDKDTTIEAREFVKLGYVGSRWGIGTIKTNRDAAQAADKVLNLVEAGNLAHKLLGKMSGGELQRIFLAQALVSEPDILLLDEPLANLDIRRESNLVSLISNIVKEKNITVLLIAHNINPLLPVVDRVLYVANGAMTLGTTEEVLTSDTLTKLYGISIEVLRDSKGRLAIIGIEESGLHDHEHDTHA